MTDPIQTMTKRTWQSAAELATPATLAPLTADSATTSSELAARNEFGPAVALAIADLRARHGVDSVSCQPDGNTPAALDALRADLSAMLPGVNRRGFLRLTGAAAVFALAACNEKHPDTLVPYAQQPEGTVLGNAVWYSTVVRDSGRPTAVMAKTYEGRPIKLEGSPDCPVARGRADARTQAALVNLYDPDRLQNGPLAITAGGKDGSKLSWSDLDEKVGAALKTGGIGLLTGPIDGPASRRLIADLQQAFGERLQHAVYEPISRAIEVQARRIAVGNAAASAPTYQVGKAAVLVTLGSDLLGEGALADHVGFGDLRALKGDGANTWMGQVIAFEPTLSQVGACADVRVRVAFNRLPQVGWALAAAVAAKLGTPLPNGIVSATALGLKPLKRDGHDVDPIAYAAEQLLAAKAAGRASLIYVSGAAHASEASLPLHLAAAYLNAVLGNEGVTVGAGLTTAITEGAGITALAAACARGEISTLIIRDADPVAGWPGFAAVLPKVKTVVVVGDRLTATARAAHFVAPTVHGLESWGDAEVAPGVFAVQQPTIQRLWDARCAEESLMAFAVASGAAGATALAQPKGVQPAQPALSVVSRALLWQAAEHGVQSWSAYVKATWLAQVKPAAKVLAADTAFWNSALSVGVIVTAPAAAHASDSAAIVAATALPALPATDSGYQLVLSRSRTIGDGTWLNNAWLNELPDPVSKITWENYLAVSPADAETNGWKDGEVVTLAVNGKQVALPIHTQDGQHPGTLETFLGWGRADAGAVARLCIEDGYSVDAYQLVDSALVGSAGLIATVTRTGATHELANVQGHNYMEGRKIALDVRFDAAAGKEVAEPAEHVGWVKGTDGKPAGRLNVWGSSHAYPGHRWGMTVDLNSCTGCNACITACTAENNVPVVGRDEVRKNREMHWIRIDRYFTGSDRLDVEVVNQPLMCQQCENAPCETVCPANATMHNDTGQNIMVYNRCIGTRYCANNCPYKVRRFNWYEYSSMRAGPHQASDQLARVTKNVITSGSVTTQSELAHAPLQMLLNPDVTVRSKGVMEKCNLCVQRTRSIRDQEHRSNRKAVDGAVTTACAQTCPTKALVFGDLNDAFSGVVTIAKQAEKRAYLLLDKELNTRPGIIYMKRLRNRPADSVASAESVAPAEKHS